MKIFFGAQGSVKKIFCELDRRLQKQGLISESQYWISDSESYYSDSDSRIYLEEFTRECLFEWIYTSSQTRPKVSLERVRELKIKYWNENLWDAVVADRRLSMGRLSKSTQSYETRYSDSELEEIIFSSLDAIEDALAKFSPDCIVTFVPATYGDMLLWFAAKANGIKYLQLRSSKIDNYVFFADSPQSTPMKLRIAYSLSQKSDISRSSLAKADEYIKNAQLSGVGYEGTVITRTRSPIARFTDKSRSLLVNLRRGLFPSHPVIRSDNHVPLPLRSWYYGEAIKGRRWRVAQKVLARKTLPLNELEGGDFVFFPLHSEPEIALSVYGLPHLNQIETIRALARSVPIGHKVVVKEHPRSRGYRKIDYYKKLLSIPNVYFAESSCSVIEVIQEASLVATISGFAGFEAILARKPVVVFGDVMYSLLPDTMVCDLSNTTNYFPRIREYIENFNFNENELRNYLAAVISISTPVNLYSDLLEKSNRNSSPDRGIENQYDDLALLFAQDLIGAKSVQSFQAEATQY